MTPPSFRMTGSIFVCCTTALFLLGPARATAQCEPTWLDQFPVTDIVGTINAMTMFDEDGPGPMPAALYVAGDIRFAGANPVTGVAKWNGSAWSMVGDPLLGTSPGQTPKVYAVRGFDEDGDGPASETLLIVGDFLRPGETQLTRSGLLRLRDGVWTQILDGARIPGARCLEVFDDDGVGPNPPALIVGGSFSQAKQPGPFGTVNVSNIAKWNGAGWNSLGPGLQGGGFPGVRAIRTFDPDGAGPARESLFVGGRFATAGSLVVNNIAQWDGSSWSSLLNGVSIGTSLEGVNSLEGVDFDGPGPQEPRLIVGGYFTSAGPPAFSNCGIWNGNSWTDFSWPQSREVVSVATYNPTGTNSAPIIYAAGSTWLSGNFFTRRVMKWDGVSWGDVSPHNRSLDAFTLLVADLDGNEGPAGPSLIAGGMIDSTSEDFGSTFEGIARYDGTTWFKLGPISHAFSEEAVDHLDVLEVADSGELRKSLFAAGRFLVVNGERSRGIARWDGRSWRGVGGGFNQSVLSIEAFDEDSNGPSMPMLFAGGYFTRAGEAEVNYMARWDGENWTSLPEQPDNFVFTLKRFDPDGAGMAGASLVVGGYFSSVGSLPASYIAKWDGSSWSPLGVGLDNWPRTMCVYDEDHDGPVPPRLFVGGFFTTAGGVQVNGIARWDGSNWSEVGGGISPGGLVYQMTVFDEDEDGPIKPVLVVCGQFISAGGQNAAGIAAWDGSNWTPLATTNDSYARKSGAAGFDPDGPGPAPPELIVTDQFNTIQGISANSIARRLAGQWSTLGVSPNDGINSLGVGIASYDDDDDGPNPPSLFVGGFQTMAGGLSSERISRWSAPVPFVRAYPDAIGAKVNERVELSLDVGGLTPVSFQWYRDGSPLFDSGRISGTNSATLVIEPAYRGDSGQYELYALNQCGYGWSPAIDVGIGCQSARPNGDMDGDGSVDGHDIAAFVNILLFDSEPDETVCVADLNYDNSLDADDIEPFVSLLVSQ